MYGSHFFSCYRAFIVITSFLSKTYFLLAMRILYGVLLISVLTAFAEVVVFTDGYYHLWKHRPVQGVCLSLLQILSSFLMVSSMVICVVVDSGRLPVEIIATNVEAFTREELQKYADIESTAQDQDDEHNDGKNQLSTPVDEDAINANELAAERAEARMEAGESIMDQEMVPVAVYVKEAAVKEADHPDVIEERRKERIRLGLSVLSLPQVARNILLGIEEGGDRKREELERLFDKIKLCHYCQVYQLEGTFHCESCQRCVPHCSHHCWALGNCIGYANHKAYILYLFYTALASLNAVMTSFWVTSCGWTNFITEDSINILLYLTYNLTLLSSIILVLYIFIHIRAVGCGESMIIDDMRLEQETRERNRRETAEGTFQELHQGERLSPRKEFQWSRVRKLFGNDSKTYRYFLPFFEPKMPLNFEETIHTDLREIISMRLHSLADVIPDEPLPA